MTTEERAISRGIERKEFLPYFQPLVDLRSGAVEGFEILARWLHPRRGLVLPAEFIQVIERRNLMNGLFASLLPRAFAAAKLLPESVGLSVNVSPWQMHDRSLPDLLQGMAQEASFDLRRLTVEVTESALFADLHMATLVAQELKLRGVRLSLDDFGTGYSSLLHLQALPFDELKVDASFVRSMTTSRQSRKITASVIALGQSLGLSTVGEGVEELAQAEVLIWQGCDRGQGWLYGRPMPVDQLPSFMEQQAASPDVAPSAAPEIKGSALALESHPSARLPHLRAIYDGVPIGLGFLDRDLRYVNVNQRLAEMHGVSIEGHLGRKASEVLPHLFPEVEPFFRRALAGETIPNVRVGTPSSIPDDSPIDFIVSYCPACDEAGEVIGISIAVLDISVTLPFAHSARQALTGPQSRRPFSRAPWVVDPPDATTAASS